MRFRLVGVKGLTWSLRSLTITIFWLRYSTFACISVLCWLERFMDSFSYPFYWATLGQCQHAHWSFRTIRLWERPFMTVQRNGGRFWPSAPLYNDLKGLVLRWCNYILLFLPAVHGFVFNFQKKNKENIREKMENLLLLRSHNLIISLGLLTL